MGRIQGLAESGIKSADTLIKSGPGYVFSITIAYRGTTAGEFLTLIDGLDATGHDEVMFVYLLANGTIYREWTQGKYFETGIFLNIGATAGAIQVEMTYK